MRKHIGILLAALSLGTFGLLAGEPPIRVEKAWLRAVPPSSSSTAAFMRLINQSDQPLRLTSGSTPIAGMVMPMMTTRTKAHGGEVMGMQDVDALTVPAHGELQLAPGGDHLMVMQLKEHPKAGETVKLTLHFEPGGEITIALPVALRAP